MRRIHFSKKRKGSTYARTPFKRRRVIRKRKNNTQSFSNRSLKPFDGQWRKPLTAKKKRIFKRHCWNASEIAQKFRSISTSVVSTLTTPTSLSQHNVVAIDAISNTNPFWIPAGGLQPVNFGIAAPTLAPDTVFLRGGTMSLVVGITPNADVDSVRLRVQLIFRKQQRRDVTDALDSAPAQDWISSRLGTYPKTYLMTLQDEPDYDEYYYRPVLDKEILLKPGDNTEFRRRIKSRRLDTDSFTRGMAYAPLWLIYASQTSTQVADVGETVQSTIGYNLSFTVHDI